MGWAFAGGAGLPGPGRGPRAEGAPSPCEVAPALPPVLGVQRTLRLLASSTAKHPQVVRILFYGQSITEGTWWQAVADGLRRRYPHAELVIENRALGGFSSQLLVKTAETDHGLRNGPHTLEVTGLAAGDLEEIRVYRPPLEPRQPLQPVDAPIAPVPSP